MNLLPLPGGNVLVTGSGAVPVTVLPPSPPPLLSQAQNLMAEPGGLRHGLQSLIADPRRHLWGVGTDWSRGETLEEWDGVRWRSRPIPKFAEDVTGLLACDTGGHLWLQARPFTGGTVIYDPARDTWTYYPGRAAALQAAAPLGVMLQPVPGTGFAAALSGDGWAVDTDGETISLYDGKTWRHWKASEIETGFGYVETSDLHLNRGGLLTVRLDSDYWKWTPAGGWQRTEAPVLPLSLPPYVPVGVPVSECYNLPTDSTGASWLNWKGTVYKNRQSLWARIEPLSSVISPFRDGRPIRAIYTDPRGRLFFQTQPLSADQHFELIAWQPPIFTALPAPHIQVAPFAMDAVVVRFTSPLHRAIWFQWRLNGNPWSHLLKADNSLGLTLLVGDYRVEAQAVDDLLQVSPQPAVAVFSIRPALPASAGQIALLGANASFLGRMMRANRPPKGWSGRALRRWPCCKRPGPARRRPHSGGWRLSPSRSRLRRLPGKCRQELLVRHRINRQFFLISFQRGDIP